MHAISLYTQWKEWRCKLVTKSTFLLRCTLVYLSFFYWFGDAVLYDGWILLADKEKAGDERRLCCVRVIFNPSEAGTMSFDWNLQTGASFMKGNFNYEIKHKVGEKDLSFLVKGHAINYWIYFSSSKR